MRNAFAVSPKGTDANLIGVFINSGSSEMNLTIQYTSHTGGTSRSVSIHEKLSAGQVISFGNPGVKQAVFRGADVKPGALLTIFLQYGSVSGKNLQIPVLNAQLQAYKNLGPSPLPTHTPTPTPTATLTPTPSAHELATSAAGPIRTRTGIRARAPSAASSAPTGSPRCATGCA